MTLQDPENASSSTLLESLLAGCAGMSRGGALFAFASSPGIELLFDDDAFVAFMDHGTFDLVVGVDAITNVAALNALARQIALHNGLRVRVFLHRRRYTTFHPKFAWFGSQAHGCVVLGSGNLTPGGLTRNWEATTSTDLTAADVRALEREWNQWMTRNVQQLRTIDDPAVIARAARNVTTRIITDEAEDETEETTAEVTDDDAVLLAELPRAGDRWNQANFDIRTFGDYFHLTPGATRRVLLRQVVSTTHVGPRESRPSVARRSKNYSIELAAAAGRAYPTNGRPIAVFLRVAVRSFRYMLLMPGDPNFSRVERLLTQRWVGRADRMRRVVLPVADLRAAWPGCPL